MGSSPKDYQARYGDPEKYILHCAKAHHSTGQRCVLCTKKSEEIHHAYYVGNNRDEVGINTFPVCKSCHESLCHDSGVWIRNSDPMKSRNVDEFIFHLQSRYLFVSQIFNNHKGVMGYGHQHNSRNFKGNSKRRKKPTRI